MTVRSRMTRRWFGGLAAACLVMTLSACNEWGPHQTVASPSDDPSLAAAIRLPLLQTVGDNNIVSPQPTFVCSQNNQFTGPVDVVMTAGQDVDLHQVTIRLVDGTFTDDSNKFTHEDLAEDFVQTQIPAGTVRTFRFHTRLRCGLRIPEIVAADIRFIEASGRKNSVTVSVRLDTTVIVRTPL